MTDETRYSERFVSALEQAARWHRTQLRKGTTNPYISHPLRVCALVLDDGGTEDEACAALLHDAVEDTPATIDDLRRLFGADVARIVELCSDDDGAGPDGVKPPWKHRKETHFEHLRGDSGFDVSVARVMAADKLANLTTQLDDAATQGAESWDRFKGGIAGTLWYLETATALVTEKLCSSSRLPAQLAAGLDQLRAIRDSTGLELDGLDRRIAAAINGLPAPTLEGWNLSSVELAAFEIARRIRRRGGDPRTATVSVLASWFAQPLPTEPAEREQQIDELAAGTFAPVVATVVTVRGVGPT